MKCQVGDLHREGGRQRHCARAKTPAPISTKKDQIFAGKILLSTCAQCVAYIKIQDEERLNVER